MRAFAESMKQKKEKKQEKASKVKKQGYKIDVSDPKKKRTLPKGLSGHSKTSDGTNICFSYNTEGKGCSAGDKCSRGAHVCMVCFEKHPSYQHPK